MVYLIVDQIEVTSKAQLEEIIAELPEESKTALRSLYHQEEARQLGQQ